MTSCLARSNAKAAGSFVSTISDFSFDGRFENSEIKAKVKF
jgi:hypothetical protein